MDIPSKRHIWQIIEREKRKKCIIVVTQDMHEAHRLGDRIGLLANGKIAMCGSRSFIAEKFDHSVNLVFTLKPQLATTLPQAKASLENHI